MIIDRDPSRDLSVSPTRRIHDKKQITDVSQLAVGKDVLLVCGKGNVSRYTVYAIGQILAAFSTDDIARAKIIPNDGWMIGCRPHYLDESRQTYASISLADHGVVPYEQGGWNPTNYMLPA